MRRFEFNEEKNILLKKTRGISFDDIIEIMKARRELDTIEHPNKHAYPHQRIYVVQIKKYAYVIPYIYKTKDIVFLKTIYPSRFFTKKYIKAYEKQNN